MTQAMCADQTRETCYGFALDKGAEYDGVCGWSPLQNACAVVSIGEEPKEEAMCHMFKSIRDCNGGSPFMGKMGAGMGGMPPSGASAGFIGELEKTDWVCAWNPLHSICKDGQLENEVGDLMFGPGGIPALSGCAWGNPTRDLCPEPLCKWTTKCVSAGWNPFQGSRALPLRRTKPQTEESTSTNPNPWMLTAWAYIMGLVFAAGFVSFVCVFKQCTKQTSNNAVSLDRLI